MQVRYQAALRPDRTRNYTGSAHLPQQLPYLLQLLPQLGRRERGGGRCARARVAIGGSSALGRLCSCMARGFDHGFQLLTGVEGDHTPRRDRNFLAGLRIAPGTLRLFAQLKIAEPGQLDAVARFERDADLLEKT